MVIVIYPGLAQKYIQLRVGQYSVVVGWYIYFYWRDERDF